MALATIPRFGPHIREVFVNTDQIHRVVADSRAVISPGFNINIIMCRIHIFQRYCTSNPCMSGWGIPDLSPRVLGWFYLYDSATM